MNHFAIICTSGFAIALIYVAHPFFLRIISGSSGMPSKTADAPIMDVADADNFERIKNALENDRIFTDPFLTVDLLSAYVHLHPKKVSQLINHYAGMNFNQLINKYRIAESKKLLSDAKYGNLTMQGIAKEAGFNSRSVFNHAFKLETGLTPSGFKKECTG
ncbi:helix-turn-helix domain-containing protein [Flavobacterium sp.]|uniref:helix-turn-helix domain-containing protein n=1 Tax=Flavobacterium sp. TaxID=239 RepID=UPI004034757E